MKKRLYSVILFALIGVSVFTFQTSRGPHVEAFGLPGPFGGTVSVTLPCTNPPGILRTVIGVKGGLIMLVPTTLQFPYFTGSIPSACVLGSSFGFLACCTAFVCYGGGYVSLFEGSSPPGCLI